MSDPVTFVSYAQNLEDVVIWRALKHVERGFFIDVGAAWPDFHSVTKAFYDRGWRGINVEPNPTLLAQLNLSRIRDINLGVAIGDSPGEVELNVMSNEGLTTVDDSIAESHESIGFERSTVTVPMTTLAELCAEHLETDRDIHFLKVDVEGLEALVLKGNDWTRFRPWLVVVEATMPMSQVENHDEWEPILTEARYRFVYADGLNRYYLSDDHAELKVHFRYPPNIFDGYMSVEMQQLQITLNDANTRLSQLTAQYEAEVGQLIEKSQGLSERLTHYEGAENYRASRGVFAIAFFHSDGRPRRMVRRALFHSDGRCRSLFRRLVLKKDGTPRRAFRYWMKSPGYRSLPRSVRF